MISKESSQIVFMLFTAFPQPEGKMGEERLRIYRELIADLDFERTKKACLRLLQELRFLPTIAEIRAAERDLRLGQRRAGMEAWGDVVGAIGAVGSYRSPTFADPLVARVVRCMGWRELCLGDNESALRARFIEAYDAITDRELREEAVAEPLRLAAPAARGMAKLGAIKIPELPS